MVCRVLRRVGDYDGSVVGIILVEDCLNVFPQSGLISLARHHDADPGCEVRPRPTKAGFDLAIKLFGKDLRVNCRQNREAAYDNE